MVRTSNTEARRSQIVDALMATMAEHGYEKASIQLIARQAGLASGLLHYHFKSKSEILLALVEHLAATARRRFDELAQEASAPDARLDAYIQARLGLGPGADLKAVAAWVVIGAEAVRQPEVRAAYGAAVMAERGLVAALAADLMSARGKSVERAGMLAASLVAFMEGTFQLASAVPQAIPPGFAAPMAIALAQRFIEGEPDS